MPLQGKPVPPASGEKSVFNDRTKPDAGPAAMKTSPGSIFLA